MKLDRIALQVARSPEEVAAVLLEDSHDFFSKLSAADLLSISKYIYGSTHHGNKIQRISFREGRGFIRPIWPACTYPVPSDIIWCVLIKPVGLRAKHISLRNPILYYADLRLDLDMLRNKTLPEIWQLTRQLTLAYVSIRE